MVHEPIDFVIATEKDALARCLELQPPVVQTAYSPVEELGSTATAISVITSMLGGARLRSVRDWAPDLPLTLLMVSRRGWLTPPTMPYGVGFDHLVELAYQRGGNSETRNEPAASP